jgi:hypothetical protein
VGITELENFTFEAGYEYRLSVKEIIRVEPFVRSYSLNEVLSKEKRISRNIKNKQCVYIF